MQITFACGAMPFGPETPSRVSLGGSETAALMLAKAVAARGHEVTMFCNLPPEGRPDHFPSGQKHTDGVRYVSLQHFQHFINVNPCDVLISVRDPNFLMIPSQAKKKVLWMHDVATTRGMKRILEQMMFTFNEIWTVSEWHKNQVAEVTGYPKERIIALRNGVVKYDDILDMPRLEKQLVYASRPERGLENLIRPGGVMEHLPEYKLVVAMYEHFPEHMKPYYDQIFAWMKRLPNVEFVGGKPNKELRQIIRESAAYIYPTQFEETSCILARECIEQGTPFVTTAVGALPETLNDAGIYFEMWLQAHAIQEPPRGSIGWCKLFAMYFRDVMADKAGLKEVADLMSKRTDLYWDGVAEMVEPRFAAEPVTPFSRTWSLIQDGDVIPAMAYYASLTAEQKKHPAMQSLAAELQKYDFIHGDIGAYYESLYTEKSNGASSELYFSENLSGQRHEAILDQIATLPPGSTVFEYGCGSGHIICPLAIKFPQYNFVGYDFSPSAVDVINKGAAERKLPNLRAISELPEGTVGAEFDAIICSEVLEHVVKPWELIDTVESLVKPGGLVVFTTPFGPWEVETFNKPGRWHERAHLWHIGRTMMVEMVGEKEDFKTALVVVGASPHFRPVGNYVFTYKADQKSAKPINPLQKALDHFSRETCAACIIAYNNEPTIQRMLDSLDQKVQFVQIAHGPSKDKTREIIDEWFAARPYMRYRVIDVPKIEAYKFGFDDARNKSIENIGEICEWFLWIDTDEYLSGEIRKYLRPSACDAYLVPQHHFTVEPRGKPPEIDRPARLCRTDRGFAFKGHIHEHAELPAGGPGRAIVLPDVDLGHPGYVNEGVRKDRFMRNWPFLEWEHKEGGDRKLHKFLWFRDIIHRMRFTQDDQARVTLAREAVEWYNKHQEDMATFGPGMFMALHYLAEANTILNVGVPMKVTVQLDDRGAVLEGRFNSYEQLERVFKQLLVDEFKERGSRYY